MLKIKKFLKKIMDNTFLDKYFFIVKEYKNRDKELDLLPILCSKKSNSLDIGAAQGFYTYFILKNSSYCFAFEANPNRALRLSKIFNSNRVKVYNSALSNKEGKVELRVPVINGKPFYGRGTIEQENAFDTEDMIVYELDMQILDKLSLRDIGFIKIDVEGHELAVLMGANDLINECKPNLLIEAEERHKADAVMSIDNFLSKKGYCGYYIFENRLNNIKDFNPKIHQCEDNVGGLRYVNNFIFISNMSTKKEIESFIDKKSA